MKNNIKYKYLFNFSVSYSGGGLKRLTEYVKWFNNNGGAYFIIHQNCKGLISRYENNKYYVVQQSKLSRLLNDCAYLKKIVSEGDGFDLYYAYGIPLYKKVAALNWFHLSNILPLAYKTIPLPFLRKIELVLLGAKIKRNIGNAEIISAESNYSIELIKSLHNSKAECVVSHNGGDDELLHSKSISNERENIAVIVGTYSYKRIVDSYMVYKHLKKKNQELKLIIIGKQYNISPFFKNNTDIKLTGNIPREEVAKYLKKARFYISNTLIENSYNAASEGVFLAAESYISDIAPHRELLSNIGFGLCPIDGLKLPMIHLKREDVVNVKIDSWSEVVNQTINVVNKKAV